MYYIYKCVFVLLILRSSCSFEKKYFILTEPQKVDCYLSASLRWFRLRNASGEELSLFFTFKYLLWTQLGPKVHINKQSYRSIS